MSYIIYHNPRCSKSREALNYLKEQGIEPEIIDYQRDKISVKDFKLLLARLSKPAEALLRTKDTLFKEKYKGLKFNDDEWIEVMREYPKLMERPIVVKGNTGVIGRPFDEVKRLVEGRVSSSL